ncbi:MAG: T9SS type A sorting domain-containing protein [Bacteroidia bacterium]|nr:T9SS type A sorting domain-containing protein [Bacteroidia bacterium]
MKKLQRGYEKGIILAFLFLLFTNGAFAQSTWSRVHKILQANCTGSGCHGGSSPILFDLGASETAVYNALVNQPPANPAANAKGNKLIDPGHPYNSFLLRKIGNNMDSYFGLQVAEGNEMPTSGSPPLDDYEVELVRQWVLAGAPQSGNAFDTSLVYDYYKNGLGMAMLTPPAPPAANQGKQIRLGPIFLDKLSASNYDEVEYLKKEKFRIPYDSEVSRIDGFMNWQSHHFLLFVWDDSATAAQYDEGLRLVSILNTATDGNKAFTGAWQFDGSRVLPEGTAYFWDKTTWLDLNYHIKNYSTDSILAVDFYMNVYYQPRGSGKLEMKAHLQNNGGLFLFPQQSTTLTMTENFSGDGKKLWMISSHTHKFGTDYDIYVRNPNGSKGDQIYEGFYNEDYTFPQGFYNWTHPAVRTWDSLYLISKGYGLIHETSYNNTSNNFVTFGLTTNDEMQLSTYLYVDESAVGTDPEEANPFLFNLYPNPAHKEATLTYNLKSASEITVDLVDYTGKIYHLESLQDQPPGTHQVVVNAARYNLATGVYFARLGVNGDYFTKKMVLVD